MTDWVEIIVPAVATDVDDVAALLADAIEPAREGTEIRGDEVVIWAPLATSEATLAEVRTAIAAFAAAGLGVDPATVRAQPALPEAEWRDAWKRYFHVSRLTRRIVVSRAGSATPSPPPPTTWSSTSTPAWRSAPAPTPPRGWC